MANGYLLKTPERRRLAVGPVAGRAWAWSISPTRRPAAGIGDKLRALVDMGVDCFKTDFGERIPTDVVYHDGSDPLKMHNYYTYLYNKTVFELLEEKLGKGEAAVFARSATAGGQQFPVHWGGDCTATFESMAESLRGGLSLGLSGFGFWSHDIGGFEQTASADVYKRWCAFGLLSSHSRLHGSSSYRVPWLFDEEAVDVLRFFTKLKCRLMPYLFGAAVQAHEHGHPGDARHAAGVPRRPGLRHARPPVHAGRCPAGGAGLPPGRHGGLLPARGPLDALPDRAGRGRRALAARDARLPQPAADARPNSVIAVGANDQQPDYDFADGVTLHVFELQEGAPARRDRANPQGQPGPRFELARQGSDQGARCRRGQSPGASCCAGWEPLAR